ncbi:alpha/beta hydrolase family protein [Chitinimonas naiadis]
MIGARLSPDGKHIAAIGYKGRNTGLVLIDADTLDSRLLVSGSIGEAGFSVYRKNPQNVLWVSNDLLAVSYGARAESMDLNGNKVADIGAGIIGKAEEDNPESTTLLVFTTGPVPEVAKADARTGKVTNFRIPTSGTAMGWAFDKHGELRALTMHSSSLWQSTTTISNWYKPRGDAPWEKLADFKLTDNFWVPISVPEQDNQLIVSSSIGRDTKAVFEYDTRKRQIGDLLVGHPTQDILNASGIQSGELRSVTTNGMKTRRYWLDPRWGSIQEAVDKALPNRINALSGNPDTRVLVRSFSDTDPGQWLLLDVADMSTRLIAKAKPQIDPAQMRPMEIISYPAKDGMKIPAYLTRPSDSKTPQPLVVSIHGGPVARDDWEWNAEVQILASRGYAVLQPQFRGSSGFGRKFMEAGFGQWGLAMQDDITAGVQYLIDQGIADPDRICIYGASYGGYAALYGLVKTPQLYRCGVSFAGVSDLEYFFKDASDRNENSVARELMQSWVGDSKQDQAKFAEVSPLKRAKEIQVPVLLLHGTADMRVPLSHSRQMVRALESFKKPCEWYVFPGEAHGLERQANKQLYYEKLLTFLEKHLGPTPQSATPFTSHSVHNDKTQNHTCNE